MKRLLLEPGYIPAPLPPKPPARKKAFSCAPYASFAELFLTAKDHYFNNGTDRVFFSIPGKRQYLMSLPVETGLWQRLETIPAHEHFKDLALAETSLFPGFQFGQALYQLGQDILFHPHLGKQTVGIPLFKLGLDGANITTVSDFATQLEVKNNHHYVQNVLKKPSGSSTSLKDPALARKVIACYLRRADKQHLSLLRQIAHLPQKSFDEMAETLYKMEMHAPKIYFDPSPGNVLLDTKRKKLRVIDPASRADAELYGCKGNNLAGMVGVLQDKVWQACRNQIVSQFNIEYSVPYPALMNQFYSEIFNKCQQAAQRHGLSQENNPFDANSIWHRLYALG